FIGLVLLGRINHFQVTMSMITFSDNKAGMAGLDKEKIQKIIDQSSGESFSSFAKKKQERLEKQQNEIRAKMYGMSEATKKYHQREMAELCLLLETQRSLDRDCVHIDMDAFYAAVEMRDDPRLRDIPMAVGGSSMLSTSNYAARQFGVRAGMPGFIGLRLCSHLEIVPTNFDKYISESRVLSSILSDYDPSLTMGSLDEAYLDLTDYLMGRVHPVRHNRVRYSGDCVCRLPLLGTNDQLPVGPSTQREETCPKCTKIRIIHEDEVEFGVGRSEVVKEIRFRVEQATGLTCSAGIAPNFMLAKVCSDQNKPNGQFELENDLHKVNEFVRELPTRKVAGIGRVSEAHLSALGMNKCGDIISLAYLLPCAFSTLGVESMLRVGLGLGSNMHSRDSSESSRKSISIERSFSPTSDSKVLTEMLQDLCNALSEQASTKIRSASGLSLKVKLSSFDVLTRCASVPIGCDLLDADRMFTLGKVVLLNLLSEGKELRLLGVRLYKLIERSDENQREEKGESVLDMLKKGRVNSEKGEKKEEEGEDAIIVVEKRRDRESVWDMLKRRRVNKVKEGGEEEEDEDEIIVLEKEGDDTPLCPVCRRCMKGMDETQMNWHVDECLNKKSIKDLLMSDYVRREENPATQVKRVKSKTQQKTMLNFFPKSG
ncbi:hypothetical protein PFISCL1PPCAC_10424, partial [Pristionchus fissidentatus]